MQEGTDIEKSFIDITRNVVTETVRRNDLIPPTQAVKITTMAGCSQVNKK
jgi:ATP-binding protein involved in chromosome partitioning